MKKIFNRMNMNKWKLIKKTVIDPSVSYVSSKGKQLFSKKYLLFTNTSIAVGLSCVGDALVQSRQMSKKELHKWNYKRTSHVAFTGLLSGPFCHFWYIYLDRWIPGSTFRIVIKKMIVDQLICSPVYIGMFLFTTTWLEDKPWQQLKEEMKDKSATLYIADWLIWPPAQIINFMFLPTKYRVLYDNTISLGYDCYFSHVKYGNHDHQMECANELQENIKEDL